MSGKGHLSNLELNGEFISAALHLPPWVVVSRVVCDTIRARVPFTNITTDPVNFVSFPYWAATPRFQTSFVVQYVGQVLVEISTSTQNTAAAATVDPSSRKFLDQLRYANGTVRMRREEN